MQHCMYIVVVVVALNSALKTHYYDLCLSLSLLPELTVNNQVKENHPKQFRLDYALSREETNSREEKM